MFLKPVAQAPAPLIRQEDKAYVHIPLLPLPLRVFTVGALLHLPQTYYGGQVGVAGLVVSLLPTYDCTFLVVTRKVLEYVILVIPSEAVVAGVSGSGKSEH